MKYALAKGWATPQIPVSRQTGKVLSQINVGDNPGYQALPRDLSQHGQSNQSDTGLIHIRSLLPKVGLVVGGEIRK